MRRLVLILAAIPLWGWGPHPQIVRAALATLPAEDRISERLGENVERLAQYVMLGDQRDSYIANRGDTPFYSNDYLIFPLAPRHYQHDVPDVTNTYRPFFLRALQALRTETPLNAARWIGSLLHFVTDTGAPPHAASIKGEAHTRMENWVNASEIQIKGYVPRLLGKTDGEAMEGLLDRMNGLVKFSTLRAARLVPLVEANDRPGCEPIELESANESARAAADVLHTLLVLSAEATGAELQAEIPAPAKLVLLNTTYSTLSDGGTLILRNLPPGEYEPVVYGIGSKALFPSPIKLKAGDRLRLKWKLESAAPAGNLVRNPDFKARWVRKDSPDHWRYDGKKQCWISDNIKVDPGQTYLAGVRTFSETKVALEWMAEHWRPLEEPVEFHRDAALVTPSGAKYARLLIYARGDPSRAVQEINLRGK